MDRIVTASEANERFSEMLREVADGNSFTVTPQGHLVAKVVPVTDEHVEQKERVGDWLAYVNTLPPMVIGPWTRDDLYE